jgi:hypothetical protein
MNKGNPQMTTTAVKQHITQAIDMEWPAFEARHPNLAGLLDQSAVIDRAAAQLADDPEYRRAMAEATEIGMGAEAATHLARAFVHDWMARLLY